MGHTGAAVVTSLGTYAVHIDGGISLPAGESTTIGLNGSGAEIELPSNFPSGSHDTVPMSKRVWVVVDYTGAGAANEPPHVHIAKTDSPFTITITNDSDNKATATLEILVQYMHSLIS